MIVGEPISGEPSSSAIHIKITPYTPQVVRFRGEDTFRVRILASDANRMPNEIFGHQRSIIDYDTNATLDEFCFVCSPLDLVTYPAGSPNPDQFPAFFRKDTIDILVPGVTMAADVIADVEAQVCRLV